MAQASRDQNRVTTLLAVSNADGITPVVLYADPTTHRLLVSPAGGSGDVVGPASSTDNAVVRFDGTTGKLIQNSGVIVDDTNNVTGMATLTLPNTGLHLLDTNASHDLIIAPGSDITADRTLTLTTGDADRTLTMTGNLTMSGAFNLTLTTTGATNVTLPTTGTLATLAGSEAFTNKTVNGLTITSTTGTLTIASGKTDTFNNTLTFSGTDGKALVLTNGLTVTTNDGTLAFGAASKTLTVNKSITLDGTDSTTMTFPSTSATIARTDAGQTFTGTQIMTSPKILTSILDTNGNESIDLVATASAVNEVEITNAATGTTGPLIKAQGETNVDLRVSGKGTGAVHNISGTYGDITAYSPSAAATATLTLNTSNIHTITMPAGNITIALSNEHVGQCFIVNIIQDSGGSRTVTWFTTIKWAGGSAPTLTTTANKIDTLGFIVTSAGNYQGYVIGQNL